jgi:predicted nucleic acid-binding protein
MLELADTTVWGRRHLAPIRSWFATQIVRDQIGITDIVKLEILHTARTGREFDELREELDSLPQAPVGPAEWERALDVMQQLSHLKEGQQHRAVKPADLLVAAAAESRGWTVVHYDQDYERIADVTGQSARWVAARGSL